MDTISEYRLTLITAPAGYGKTTLVTSWLTQKRKKSKSIITWLSLSEDDNEEECFWSDSYLGWSGKSLNVIPTALPGIENFYIAGQWTRPSGGISSAMMTEKECITKICMNERKKL